MIDLSIDVDQFDVEEQLMEVVTEFLQDFSALVITTTPYKTGFLRGSWYATIGEGGTTTGAGGSTGDPMGRVSAVIATITLGDTYSLTNGANYGPFVEFGTKYMAPRAWCRAAIDQAPALLEAAAARVRD